jgi:hypothetical protein
MQQSFLLMQQRIWNPTNYVRGVSRHRKRMVTFTARQALDAVSRQFVAAPAETTSIALAQ